MGAKRLPKEADMGYFPYSVVYRSKRHAKDSSRADTRNCRCGFEKFTLRRAITCLVAFSRNFSRLRESHNRLFA